jgi:hypothetical protein
MKIKSQRDFASGLLFLVLGGVCATTAASYRVGTSGEPGEGFFPLILSVMLMVLGALVLFKALTLEADGGHPLGPIAWRALGAIVLAVVLFGVALPRLGLLIATALLVLTASTASKGGRWRAALLCTAVLTAGTWAVFVWGLKLDWPLWPV